MPSWPWYLTVSAGLLVTSFRLCLGWLCSGTLEGERRLAVRRWPGRGVALLCAYTLRAAPGPRGPCAAGTNLCSSCLPGGPWGHARREAHCPAVSLVTPHAEDLQQRERSHGCGRRVRRPASPPTPPGALSLGLRVAVAAPNSPCGQCRVCCFGSCAAYVMQFLSSSFLVQLGVQPPSRGGSSGQWPLPSPRPPPPVAQVA